MYCSLLLFSCPFVCRVSLLFLFVWPFSHLVFCLFISRGLGASSPSCCSFRAGSFVFLLRRGCCCCVLFPYNVYSVAFVVALFMVPLLLFVAVIVFGFAGSVQFFLLLPLFLPHRLYLLLLPSYAISECTAPCGPFSALLVIHTVQLFLSAFSVPAICFVCPFLGGLALLLHVLADDVFTWALFTCFCFVCWSMLLFFFLGLLFIASLFRLFPSECSVCLFRLAFPRGISSCCVVFPCSRVRT